MSVIDVALPLASFALAALGFYFASVRPERKVRRRFFDEALGHSGSDGLPARPSLFERLDAQDRDLAAVRTKVDGAALLNGKGDQVIRDLRALKAWAMDHSELHDAALGLPVVPPPRRSRATS